MMKPGRRHLAMCAVVLSAIGFAPSVLPAGPPNKQADPKASAAKKKKARTKRGNAGQKKVRDSKEKKGHGASKRQASGENESKKSTADKAAAARAGRNLAAKGLRMIVEDAKLEALPFEDFVDWVGRETGAQMVVHWRVLEEAGVGRSDPLSVEAKNVSMRGLLLLAFDQLTDNLQKAELAARADGNILTISTRKDLNAKLVTRIYDVEDLLIALPELGGVMIDATADPRGRTRVSGWRQPGRGESKEQIVQKLIETITSHLEPGSWKTSGGKGTIRFFRGRLVVYNNLDVHQLLAGAIGQRRG